MTILKSMLSYNEYNEHNEYNSCIKSTDLVSPGLTRIVTDAVKNLWTPVLWFKKKGNYWAEILIMLPILLTYFHINVLVFITKLFAHLYIATFVDLRSDMDRQPFSATELC